MQKVLVSDFTPEIMTEYFTWTDRITMHMKYVQLTGSFILRHIGPNQQKNSYVLTAITYRILYQPTAEVSILYETLEDLISD